MVRKPFEMVLPEDLLELARAFHRTGYDLYVVGGAVRDAIMGRPPKDFDVATDATPDEVIDLMKSGLNWRVMEVGKAFGVVRVQCNDSDYEYEVATFRQDVGEGRRPESVVFSSIEEDVKRRDLTVNALFYDIMERQIVDMVGGLDDIKAGVVRTVGCPEDRFREDRLRVLRAIRFAARFRWSMDRETMAAIDADNNLNGVSPERIRDEFVKGLVGNVETFIGLLDRYRMWSRVFPGLDVVMTNVWSSRVPVVLAALFRREHSKIVGHRLNELKYTSTEIAQASFLIDVGDLTPANAYRFAKRRVAAHVDDELMCHHQLHMNYLSSRMYSCFMGYRPSVSGDDLIAEGFAGVALGRELERRETVRFEQLLEEYDRNNSQG